MILDDFPIVEHKSREDLIGSFQQAWYDDSLRVRLVKVSPTVEQRKILLKWFEVYRKVYNLGVKQIREELFAGGKQKTFSERTLRNIVRTKYDNEIKDYLKTKIPSHTIDYAIFDVIYAYKAALANLKAKNIKYFKLRYKKLTKPKMTLVLESSCFSDKFNSFQTSVMGKSISTDKSIKGIKNNCRLSLDKRSGKMILNVPERSYQVVCCGRNDYCACDPGVRTFQTMYDGQKTIDFGSREPEQIKTLLKKIDKVKRFANQMWYKKYTNRLYNKIQHTVEDLHWKTALDLVRNYNKINIGNMSTKSICKKSNKLPKITKRVCYMLAHYRFKLRIMAKAEQYGATVEYVDEAYTSKTCGACMHKHPNLKGKKIYRCPQDGCGFVWGRDQNGARNIALRSFGLFHYN